MFDFVKILPEVKNMNADLPTEEQLWFMAALRHELQSQWKNKNGDLADAANISLGYVSQLAKGTKINPSRIVATRIAHD
jgi:hypothetical protein